MKSEVKSKIFSNTLALYLRQILVLFVGLFTVRVVLRELGIEDFGIFSAVSGLVAMGSFLAGSLAQATQRYFSFALGEQNDDRLRKIFSVNLLLYLVIAFIALCLLQTLGYWFVTSHMTFPLERAEAGAVLYKFASFTFVISIITSPFIAIIIAHEDMKIYAYLSIVEVTVKLCVVFLLQYSVSDKLEIYGLLLLCAASFSALLYAVICVSRYSECQFRRFYWDPVLLREILGFTGWTVFGQISTVARTHAITVLLNQSFNPTVVAARAISIQITSALNSFTGSFSTALYPPIIKNYSSGNLNDMFRLVSVGSRLTFFLLWIFALPLIVEMDTVLRFWLSIVPPDAVLFSRLALLESLIFSLSIPLTAAARAPGKMRAYELTLGCMQFGIFLAAWFVVRSGAQAYCVFIVGIVANILMFFIRLYIVNMLTGLPVMLFLKEAVVPTCLMAFTSAALVLIVKCFFPIGLYWSALLLLISFLLSSTAMYVFCLDKYWRAKVLHILWSRILKRSEL